MVRVDVCNLTVDMYYLHLYIRLLLVSIRVCWNLTMEHSELNRETILLCRPTRVRGILFKCKITTTILEVASFGWVCVIWERACTPFSSFIYLLFIWTSVFGYISIHCQTTEVLNVFRGCVFVVFQSGFLCLHRFQWLYNGTIKIWFILLYSIIKFK